jgi:hypothetical protein
MWPGRLCALLHLISLARHLHSEHRVNAAEQKIVKSATLTHTANEPDITNLSDLNCAAINNESTKSETKFNSQRAAATFVASLLSSSSVTQRTVQCVVEHAQTMINDVV